jgi:hypothetical protein
LLPPVGAGFVRFLEGSNAKTPAVEKALQRAWNDRSPDPYDSHPPTRVRVEAVQARAGAAPSSPPDPTPAYAWLADPEALEREVYVPARGRAGERFRPVSWDDVGEKAWVGLWSDVVKASREQLAGVTPEALPDAIRGRPKSAKARDGTSRTSPREELVRASVAAVALSFRRAGWTVHAPPGEEIEFRRDGQVLRPFESLASLSGDAPQVGPWRDVVDRAGIGGVDLSKTVSST